MTDANPYARRMRTTPTVTAMFVAADLLRRLSTALIVVWALGLALFLYVEVGRGHTFPGEAALLTIAAGVVGMVLRDVSAGVARRAVVRRRGGAS